MSVLSALRLSHAPVAAFAAVGVFWGSFAALVPQMKAQIGASDAEFGALLLGTSVGLLSTMLLAPLIDRKLGRHAMPVAGGLFAFAALFPGLTVSPLSFVLVMVFMGLTSGLLDVIMNARVSELEARHHRPLMNANHGMFSVAYACGAVVTGMAREFAVAPFFVFASIAVVILCLVSRMGMEVEKPEARVERRGQFPVAMVLICGGVVLIAFMVEASVEAWSALHVERTLGGGAAEGALGPAMLGLTMALGRLGGQAVCEKLSDLRVIFWAALLSFAGIVTVAVAPSPYIAYLGFGVVGLGVSVIGPLGLAIVGRLVPPSVRTTAISRTAVIGFAGFFIAPAAMGVVSEVFGLRLAFAMLAVLALGLFPLLVVLRRRGA